MRSLMAVLTALLLVVPGPGLGAAPRAASAIAAPAFPDPSCASPAGDTFAGDLKIMPEITPLPGQPPVAISVTKQAPQVTTLPGWTLALPYQLLYNGSYPGPTIRVPSALSDQTISSQDYRGAAGPFTQVTFTNELSAGDPSVPFPYFTTHLHGGHTAPEHDGHPDDLFSPFPAPWPYPLGSGPVPPTNQHTYVYTNSQQPQILWYHDHADSNTADHVSQGLFGFYVIDESDPDLVSVLPPRAYDIPLGFQVLPADGNRSFVAINGVQSPIFHAEPRNYRFRLLNASAGQSIDLRLCDGSGNRVDLITQIGSDGGLLPAPLPRSSIEIFQAERYDVVANFTSVQGPLYLYGAIKQDIGCTSVSSNTCVVTSLPIMQILVDQPLNGSDPTQLDKVGDSSWGADSAFLFSRYCAQRGLPPDCPLTPDRVFEFDMPPTESDGDQLAPPFRINGQAFSKLRPTYSATLAADGSTIQYPRVVNPTVIAGNAVEVWKLVNRIDCMVHPIHIHDVEFQVLAVDDQPVDPAQFGWKDVFVLRPLAATPDPCAAGAPVAPTRSVTIIGYFENHWLPTDIMDTPEKLMNNVVAFPEPNGEVTYWKSTTSGAYVFHCHNLFHEDNAMMGQFVVDPPPFTPPPGGGR